LAQAVGEILATARTLYWQYHAGQLSREAMATQRRVLEAKLLAVLTNAPVKGWPADAQRLANRIQRYWIEWFTFLDHPEVKPAGLTQLSHAIALQGNSDQEP
jgi:hypothetical protein